MSRMTAIMLLCCLTGLLAHGQGDMSQENLRTANPMSIPPVIRLSGTLKESTGLPCTTVTNATFAIFKGADGGEPIWTEVQEVQPDSNGHFSIFLGAMHPHGLPAEIFNTGDARWVEISAPGIVTPPRVALVSVPYALKAVDAETLGGRPLSDFALVDKDSRVTSAAVMPIPGPAPSPLPRPLPYPLQGPSTAPNFTSTAESGPSFISRARTGSPFLVRSAALVDNLNADLLHGFSDAAFAKLLSENFFTAAQTFAGGTVFPPVKQLSPGSNLFPSSSQGFESSALDPVTGKPVTRELRWFSNPVQTPAGSLPAAQLQLAFGIGGAIPSPTGFWFNSDGTLNFVPNQTFPSGAILAAVNQQSTSTDPSVAPVVYTSDYQWQQQPQSQNGKQGIVQGLNTITLNPCPKGVNGSDIWHYISISGTGTPEVVLISGGTCKSDAQSGTLQFVAAYAHPIGYTIGSATSGLQEAVNSATLPNSSGQAARPVFINPGQYTLQARLSVRASNVHVSGYGATLTCAMSDTCVMLGDPSNVNAFLAITLEGVSMQPGVVNGTFPAIEDNAEGSQLLRVAAARAANSSQRFGYMIQVDNDQAASINGFDMRGTSSIRCDTQFCGSAIYAPGPFGINAAVGWINNANIDPQCAGNGVDWQSGNTVQIINSVIEGYAQFGIRGGTARGGFGSLKWDNVYEEVGNCSNPAGNIGQAGVIAQGGDVRISGGEGPAGSLPCFHALPCVAPLTRYYIVANNPTYGSSNPLGAGVTPLNDPSTLVSWPVIPGATSYDLLIEDNVLAWYSGNSPNGAGMFAVATNIQPSNCSASVCTFLDSHGPRLNYSLAPPTYFPLLKFWPGTIVLGSVGDSRSVLSVSTLYTDQAPGGIVAEQGVAAPAVFAQACGINSGPSPIWVQCDQSIFPPSTNFIQQATMMPVKPNADAGQFTNLKGRLNFVSLGTGPSHIITLSDSNFQKTVATPNNRPTNDPNDAFIGYDQGDGNPSHIGISFGAPVSLSNYIGNVGDGANWLERLTSNLKAFNLPVKVSPVPFSKLGPCNANAEGTTSPVVDSTTKAWGAVISGGGAFHVKAYCDGTNWTVDAM